MLELPDHVLSAKEAHQDVLRNDYQFLGVDDHFPIQTIHKHLARNIAGLIPSIQEEVHSALDAVLGKDTENWKSLNLWEAWLGIVPRVTNRVIVGAPLCRNQDFLSAQVAFADDVVRNSFLLDMFPRVLQPLVGPLLVLSNRWHWRKTHSLAEPLITQRIHDMARKGAAGSDPAHKGWRPPEDMITWLIRQAQTNGFANRLTADLLSKSILSVEFAAIHTTVLTGFNLFLDLLSSDPSLNYLDTIREETTRVFTEENNTWTKQSLARLPRTDSAIKESMRISHIARSLTHRKVVAPEGVTNPAEGWHAPYGASLMLDLGGTHTDPALYEDPDRYDAWRFSREKELYEARSSAATAADGKGADTEEGLRIKRLSMVTTSPEYLPFSHGRHAW